MVMATTNPFVGQPDVAAFMSALDGLVRDSVRRNVRDVVREELRS